MYTLLLIFAGAYVATTETLVFSSLDACEAAKAEIVIEYNLHYGDERRAPKLTAMCISRV